MNKKSTFYKAVLATLLGFSLSSAASAQDLNIAVLDVNVAMGNSTAAEQINAEIMAETADDREKAQSLAAELQSLQERMQRDEATLSDAEKRNIAEEFDELGNQYNYLVQKLQTLQQERMQQFQQAYAPSLIQAIQEVVEQDGYDLVLNANAVLHANGSVDITTKVIERLNQL